VKRLWLTLAAAGTLAASPVRAQDVGTPRVEIGGSASAILSILYEDAPFVVAGGGPRVGLNVTPRIGIVVMAEVVGPVESSGTTGFYMTQLRLPLRKSGWTRAVSLTVGTAGLFSYNPHPELRNRRFDGSVAVRPAYRSLRVTGPNTVSVGVERQHGVGRHASGSIALQGFMGAMGGFAVRAAAGMSFGVGRHR
jgi:hypothetical protein